MLPRTIAEAARPHVRCLLLRCQKCTHQKLPRRALFVDTTRRCATCPPSGPPTGPTQCANQSPAYALRVALVGSAVGLATPLYVVTFPPPSAWPLTSAARGPGDTGGNHAGGCSRENYAQVSGIFVGYLRLRRRHPTLFMAATAAIGCACSLFQSSPRVQEG
jgi:hypothetical protein